MGAKYSTTVAHIAAKHSAKEAYTAAKHSTKEAYITAKHRSLQLTQCVCVYMHVYAYVHTHTHARAHTHILERRNSHNIAIVALARLLRHHLRPQTTVKTPLHLSPKP